MTRGRFNVESFYHLTAKGLQEMGTHILVIGHFITGKGDDNVLREGEGKSSLLQLEITYWKG
jgi:hypothetical protein